MNIIYK
jgi:hypothetical protein